MLSDAGADKDIADQGDATLLPVASGSGHLEVVRLASDAGADEDIAMQGCATPLFVAPGNGHLEVICLLSDAGADKDIAMQGGGVLCSSHMGMDTWRWSVCRMVALPCSSFLKVDTWRWSVCSLMQGQTRTSQCRVVPSLCSSQKVVGYDFRLIVNTISYYNILYYTEEMAPPPGTISYFIFGQLLLKHPGDYF